MFYNIHEEAFRMHLKCGGLEQAHKLFDTMSTRDPISYTLFISALVKANRSQDALELFHKMQLEGQRPDRVTFITLVGACSGLGKLSKAKSVHALLYQCGYETDPTLSTSLIGMYAKCQSIHFARLMFERISDKSVIPWNAMITAYVQNGNDLQQAAYLFTRMCLEGVKPNQVTFVALLNASTGEEQVKNLHQLLIENGFQRELILTTALIKMYGKLGCMQLAENIFEDLDVESRDIVAWNTMIAAYEEAGWYSEAMRVFWQMQLEKKLPPNKLTFIAVLRACAGAEDLCLGCLLEELLIECGLDGDEALQAGLVDMYMKCGGRNRAYEVFSRIDSPGTLVWNSMIKYHPEESLKLFRMMRQQGVPLDAVTLVYVLAACSGSADVHLLHACASESGLSTSPLVGARLVKLHGKLDDVEAAQQVFEAVASKDVVVWNAMISVYVQRASKYQACTLYHEMQLDGVSPDSVTFLTLLTVVDRLIDGKNFHSRIVVQGLESVESLQNGLISMYSKTGSWPEAEHVFAQLTHRTTASWNSIMTAYSKHGRTFQLFSEMQLEGVKPDAITFTTLLFACSHAGLAAEGLSYLTAMIYDYYLIPTLEHYGCLVDLLGRCGQPKESQQFMLTMPLLPDVAAWRSSFTLS